MGNLSSNFDSHEFACKCCGRCEMDRRFILKLQQIRTFIGKPMVVNSGFRCEKHNAEVGGDPDSTHLFGLAADIQADNSRMRFSLISVALTAGVTRIGLGKSFIHLDLGNLRNPEHYPAEVIWDYYREA